MDKKFKKVFVIMTLLVPLGYSLFMYKSELKDGKVSLSGRPEKEGDEVAILKGRKAYFHENVDDYPMVYTAIVVFIILM